MGLFSPLPADLGAIFFPLIKILFLTACVLVEFILWLQWTRTQIPVSSWGCFWGPRSCHAAVRDCSATSNICACLRWEPLPLLLFSRCLQVVYHQCFPWGDIEIGLWAIFPNLTGKIQYLLQFFFSSLENLEMCCADLGKQCKQIKTFLIIFGCVFFSFFCIPLECCNLFSGIWNSYKGILISR